MQKFTRPLTREIELAGERLALTFSERGIALRTVGSRKAPWEITWPALVCHLMGKCNAPGVEPSLEQLTEAIRSFKSTPAPTSQAPAPEVHKEVVHEPHASPPPPHEVPVSSSQDVLGTSTAP